MPKPARSNPDLCDECGELPPAEAPELYECPSCGMHCCTRCCGGKGTVCFKCENDEGVLKRLPRDVYDA